MPATPPTPSGRAYPASVESNRIVPTSAQGTALISSFGASLLLLIGVAALVGLLVAALIGASTTKRARRYRPGRPFTFKPVWFLAAPSGQSRAGLVPEMIVRPHLSLTRPDAGKSLTRR